LKVDPTEATARISELATAQLLDVPDDDHVPVTLTPIGEEVFAQIRSRTAQITERLWGDLPAEDLATAGRVLSTVLARANADF
jgi:hypothetical protein